MLRTEQAIKKCVAWSELPDTDPVRSIPYDPMALFTVIETNRLHWELKHDRFDRTGHLVRSTRLRSVSKPVVTGLARNGNAGREP